MPDNIGHVYVLSTSYGVTLIFARVEDLERVIQHLSGQLEWIHKEGIDPPYIYHINDSRLPHEEIDKWTDWVKWTIAQGLEAP